MATFCLIAIIASGVAAGLSVICLPFWLMGVPGVENSYARGWKLGLNAIIAYPVVWLCLFGFWRVERKQINVEQLAALSFWVGAGSLLLLIAAIAVILYSFRIMSRG